MKSEPQVYGICHLESDATTLWDGIRNYQARNFMRAMQPNDYAFFYHSNTKPPGIVGLMEIIETGIIDPTQFDPRSKYYDPASSSQAPRWDCVRVHYRQTFTHLLSLDQLKMTFSSEELAVVKRGNRLSILPVPEATAAKLLQLLDQPAP